MSGNTNWNKKILLDNIILDTTFNINNATPNGTICQYMSHSPVTKNILSEVHKLLQIYFNIHVTIASPERRFSSLRRINIYLRNTKT